MRACSVLGFLCREFVLQGCRVVGLYMGGCQNYGPFLGPYYNTARNV